MNRTTIEHAVLGVLQNSMVGNDARRVRPLVQERVFRAFDRTLLATNLVVHLMTIGLTRRFPRDIKSQSHQKQEDRDEPH